MGVLRVPGCGPASLPPGSHTTAAPEPVVFQRDTVQLSWDGKPIGDVALVATRTTPASPPSPQSSSSSSSPTAAAVQVTLTHSLVESKQVTLHWGVLTAESRGEWVSPPMDGSLVSIPQGTVRVDGSAAQTPFVDALQMDFPMEQGCGVLAFVFVIKRVSAAGVEMWLNAAGAGDFKIPLTPASNDDVTDRILQAEQGNRNCMYGRFSTVTSLMSTAQGDKDAMAWIYTLLRYHHTKQLDWYGSHNYQSKDIGHIKNATSLRVAQVAVNKAATPEIRRLARMSLAFLSRGGGQAEDIRMEILNIMRRHGIKEGHRNGIDDKFVEQWHQKLHQNTSNDDILICEAYLHFLHTGRNEDFWDALEQRGLSRKYLANMKNPITATPFHLPQMIDDFKGYLWILKTVHAGADLSFMIEGAKWVLEKSGDNEVVGWLYEIKHNLKERWVPAKIAETRARLNSAIAKSDDHGARDGFLLDAALEGAFRLAVEKTKFEDLDDDALIALTELVLGQSALSRECLGEFQTCLNAWKKHVTGGDNKWSKPWALRAKAMADNLGLVLGAEAESYIGLFQDRAKELAAVAGISEAHVTNFSEEIIRGQPSFLLSLCLRKLDPILRKKAGLSDWQLISSGAGSQTIGKIFVSTDMGALMSENLDPMTVVLAEEVGGNDDIPANVTALITPSTLDVLSHVAIRARNQGVFCASCSADAFATIKGLHTAGNWVSLTVDQKGRVSTEPAEPQEQKPDDMPQNSKELTLRVPEPSAALLISQGDFEESRVGGKSINLAKLGEKLANTAISIPHSMAAPFGTFEKVLSNDAQLGMKLKELEKQASDAMSAKKPKEMGDFLSQVRTVIVDDLDADADALKALDVAINQLETQNEIDSAGLWVALKHVWASKWTDRAFLSRASLGIAGDSLSMAVLLQQVLPAKMSFVLHSANPLDQNHDEVLGEIVFGMGETLVGNYPGRALCFTAKKGSSTHEVVSFPSKRLQVTPPGGTALMVRSDSNGEDLESFAGAGLYDSIVCGPDTPEEPIAYAEERCDEIFSDGPRSKLVSRLVQVAMDVEAAMDGKAQDIEGVVLPDGKIAVVQARPQVF